MICKRGALISTWGNIESYILMYVPHQYLRYVPKLAFVFRRRTNLAWKSACSSAMLSTTFFFILSRCITKNSPQSRWKTKHGRRHWYVHCCIFSCSSVCIEASVVGTICNNAKSRTIHAYEIRTLYMLGGASVYLPLIN